MRKLFLAASLFLALAVMHPAQAFTNCGDTVSDSNGHTYRTMSFGAAGCWFIDNLNTGGQISQPTQPSDNGSVEKYCYNDAADNCSTYGGLYTYNEMMNYGHSGNQGVCPSGWHLPAHSEWTALEQAAGCSSDVCKDDYTTTGWLGTSQGTTLKSSAGFAALLAGEYSATEGKYDYVLANADFWALTAFDSGSAWVRILGGSREGRAYRSPYGNASALSVRCVKDACVPATCSSLGAECGQVSDGCGNTLNCGTCTGGKNCISNICVAQSCTQTANCGTLGYTCGTYTDNCGNTQVCGVCPTNYTCNNHACVYSGSQTCSQQSDASLCAAYGATCGSISASDNCGNYRTVNSCGSCGAGQICANHTCGAVSQTCTPKNNAALCAGWICGSKTVDNGCGAQVSITCGACGTGYSCSATGSCVKNTVATKNYPKAVMASGVRKNKTFVAGQLIITLPTGGANGVSLAQLPGNLSKVTKKTQTVVQSANTATSKLLALVKSYRKINSSLSVLNYASSISLRSNQALFTVAPGKEAAAVKAFAGQKIKAQLNFVYQPADAGHAQASTQNLMSASLNEAAAPYLWYLDNYSQPLTYTDSSGNNFSITGTQGADTDALHAWAAFNNAKGNNVAVAVLDYGFAGANDTDLKDNLLWSPANSTCVDKAGNNLDCSNGGYAFFDDGTGKLISDPIVAPFPLPPTVVANLTNLGYSGEEIFNAISHGSAVADTLAAVAKNNFDGAGVAPQVKVALIKTDMTSASVIAAIEFCQANGIKIINSSFDLLPDFSSDPSIFLPNAKYDKSSKDDVGLKTAIQTYTDAGNLFITPAGNGRNDQESTDKPPYVSNNNDVYPVYPCAYSKNNPNIICVTASDQFDNLAVEDYAASNHLDAFSGWSANYGDNTVQIAAPGNLIWGRRIGLKGSIALDSSLNMMTDDNSYAWSGTSFAAPQVAAAAAIIWSANPSFSAAKVRQTILDNTEPLADKGQKGSIGHGKNGRLNIYDALSNSCSDARSDEAIVMANWYNPNVFECSSTPLDTQDSCFKPRSAMLSCQANKVCNDKTHLCVCSDLRTPEEIVKATYPTYECTSGKVNAVDSCGNSVSAGWNCPNSTDTCFNNQCFAAGVDDCSGAQWSNWSDDLNQPNNWSDCDWVCQKSRTTLQTRQCLGARGNTCDPSFCFADSVNNFDVNPPATTSPVGTTTRTIVTTAKCNQCLKCNKDWVTVGGGDPNGYEAYPTTKVGKDCWLGGNLTTALKYQGNNFKCFNDNYINCQKYGALYSYNLASLGQGHSQGNQKIQGLCPNGWHISTLKEWLAWAAQMTSNKINPDSDGVVKQIDNMSKDIGAQVSVTTGKWGEQWGGAKDFASLFYGNNQFVSFYHNANAVGTISYGYYLISDKLSNSLLVGDRNFGCQLIVQIGYDSTKKNNTTPGITPYSFATIKVCAGADYNPDVDNYESLRCVQNLPTDNIVNSQAMFCKQDNDCLTKTPDNACYNTDSLISFSQVCDKSSHTCHYTNLGPKLGCQADEACYAGGNKVACLPLPKDDPKLDSTGVFDCGGTYGIDPNDQNLSGQSFQEARVCDALGNNCQCLLMPGETKKVNESSYTKTGVTYTWYGATGYTNPSGNPDYDDTPAQPNLKIQGICPPNTHLPTKNELLNLMNNFASYDGTNVTKGRQAKLDSQAKTIVIPSAAPSSVFNMNTGNTAYDAGAAQIVHMLDNYNQKTTDGLLSSTVGQPDQLGKHYFYASECGSKYGKTGTNYSYACVAPDILVTDAYPNPNSGKNDGHYAAQHGVVCMVGLSDVSTVVIGAASEGTKSCQIDTDCPVKSNAPYCTDISHYTTNAGVCNKTTHFCSVRPNAPTACLPVGGQPTHCDKGACIPGCAQNSDCKSSLNPTCATSQGSPYTDTGPYLRQHVGSCDKNTGLCSYRVSDQTCKSIVGYGAWCINGFAYGVCHTDANCPDGPTVCVNDKSNNLGIPANITGKYVRYSYGQPDPNTGKCSYRTVTNDCLSNKCYDGTCVECYNNADCGKTTFTCVQHANTSASSYPSTDGPAPYRRQLEPVCNAGTCEIRSIDESATRLWGKGWSCKGQGQKYQECNQTAKCPSKNVVCTETNSLGGKIVLPWPTDPGMSDYTAFNQGVCNIDTGLCGIAKTVTVKRCADVGNGAYPICIVNKSIPGLDNPQATVPFPACCSHYPVNCVIPY